MSFSKTCSYDVVDSYLKELPIEKGFSTFFWYLYQNRICTDVKFLLETDYGYKEFQAHKLILSMMSPHFAEKFYKKGKCTKKMEEIVLQNVDLEAFEAMLRFMYGGFLPQLDSPKQASDLFKTATEFKVHSLVVKCKEFLNRIEVEPSNVFTFLEVGECMQNRSLIDRCLALIQRRTREVMNSYPLRDITPSMMHIILDQPYLSLPSVYELLKWVFAWAQMKASHENLKYRSMREVLEKLLPDMNFLLLSNVEFAEICRDYDGFFTSDEMASIFMNIAVPGSRAMPDWYDENCCLHVQPEQNAKSKQERVEESCMSKNVDEDVESKQNNNQEPRDQRIKSEGKKSEQKENEESSDQECSGEEFEFKNDEKQKEILQRVQRILKNMQENTYQQSASESTDEENDQLSSGEELEFENDEKQKEILQRLQGALKNMQKNTYQQSASEDSECEEN